MNRGCSTHGRDDKISRKPEVKRSLGRHKRRWEDNIRTDIRRKVWDGMVWIRLAKDRDKWRVLLNTAMKLRVP